MSQDEQLTLILVPTPMELERVKSNAKRIVDRSDIAFELCGFGPIAAAARTMQLLHKYTPRQVVLVGIAGTFDDKLQIGTVCCFERVVCDGIGVGSGATHESASVLGWNQWAATGDGVEDELDTIGDEIELRVTKDCEGTVAKELVTVCSASADSSEAAIRRQRYPDAAAEDMEGFGVAMACRMFGVPLQIIRGISNRVGDRDKANWQIDRALRSTAQGLEQSLLHVAKKDGEH